MTSLLRHIMCHESATAAMSSAVGDGEWDKRGRLLSGARSIEALVRNFIRKWSNVRLFQSLLKNFLPVFGQEIFYIPTGFW